MLDSFLEPLKMRSGAGKTPIWWKRFFNLVGPTTKQTWIPLVVYLGNGIGNGKEDHLFNGKGKRKDARYDRLLRCIYFMSVESSIWLWVLLLGGTTPRDSAMYNTGYDGNYDKKGRGLSTMRKSKYSLKSNSPSISRQCQLGSDYLLASIYRWPYICQLLLAMRGSALWQQLWLVVYQFVTLANNIKRKGRSRQR